MSECSLSLKNLYDWLYPYFKIMKSGSVTVIHVNIIMCVTKIPMKMYSYEVVNTQVSINFVTIIHQYTLNDYFLYYRKMFIGGLSWQTSPGKI